MITDAISIIAPSGVYAGITAFSGTGIIVNAAAGTVVTLKGLTLNSLGGNVGITYNSGRALHVEDSTIVGFSMYGLSDVALYLAPVPSAMTVTPTTFRSCFEGVHLNGSGLCER